MKELPMPSSRLFTSQPSSLKQKTALFILLPIFLIMISFGGIGQHLVRKILLEQWQETAIAKLQRSAHYVDMRLMRPMEILNFLQEKEPHLQRNEIDLVLDQLRSLDGVVKVNHEWNGQFPSIKMPMFHGGMFPGNDGQRIKNLSISTPRFNKEFLSETVSLFASLQDSEGKIKGHIEVVLSFYDLIDKIVKSPWWKSNQAFILDSDRNILSSTELLPKHDPVTKVTQFEIKDKFDNDTWNALQQKDFGTVFGEGSPPQKISGFYHLARAPWTLVIVAPGRQVLQPILEFRKFYYIIIWVGVLVAVLYIRLITGKTTRAINKLSMAAEDLARGIFRAPLAVESSDEVGKLTTNFNLMAGQLQERLQLQQAMSVAREVQQNLLPQGSFVADGLEVAGITLYCDETGGDYIDLLHGSSDERKTTVVVGDVAGHGIGAALLMASVRALIRGRACCSGNHNEIADDVNKMLCMDTEHSGNFVTLFCIEVDRKNELVNWVRCGHDPALLYCPNQESFTELRGDGLVLGVDRDYSYSGNSLSFPDLNQVILIGSDGAWEAQNEHGERFGKDRIRSLLSRYHELRAERIIEKIKGEIKHFLGAHPQNDDITLAIIKTW